IQRLISQGGNAYIRNLIAAEAAVRRGEFSTAKILRVAAYLQRSLAMRLARFDDSQPSTIELLQTNLSELRELDAVLQTVDSPDNEARVLSEQIIGNAQQGEALLLQALFCRESHTDV